MFPTEVSCPSLLPQENCTVTSYINVTYNANLGNQTIYINMTWLNPDATQGNLTKQAWIYVFNNSALRVTETIINYSLPLTSTRTVGNFTIDNFGNTELSGVTFSENGTDSASIHSWITYTPSSVVSVAKNGVRNVLVNITVPANATPGVYTANLIANATTSSNMSSSCWNYVVLNLTVEPYDWERTPATLAKTVVINTANGSMGTITITNNKNVAYTFNVSVDGDESDYISVDKSTFILPASSTQYVYVYHNTSQASAEGTYTVNVTLANQNGTVPLELNTTVMLSVIKMNLAILSPNQTNPVYGVNASDRIDVSANLTLNDAPLTENVTWYARIGDQECTSLQSGYNATSLLWVLNCTAPVIQGNVINNTLNVSVYYTTSTYFFPQEESNAVNYDDIIPPQFASFSLSGADSNGFINWSDNVASIYATVNVTDNAGVSSAWAIVTYPNSTAYTYTMFYSSGYWRLNTQNPNQVGDYKIDVYANDTSGLTNSTTGTQVGFFDVYRNIRFLQDITTRSGQPLVSNITLYKPGTSWIIHNISSNSSGSYNQSIHQRDYDMKIEIANHTIILYSANINTSAVAQHGMENPSNITNPLRLDSFPNRYSSDISNIELPTTAENMVMAFVIEPQNLTYTLANITLNYTEALAFGSYQENKFEIFRCTTWNYLSRVCTGSFDYMDRGLNPDVVNNLFVFTATPSTAYAIAESCYPNTCGSSPPSTPSTPQTGGTSGGSSSSAQPRVSLTSCGNGACESGENEANCPEDCIAFPFVIQTGLSEIRMQPGDTRIYNITIENLLNRSIDVTLAMEGLQKYIKFDNSSVRIGGLGSKTISATVEVPENTSNGLYTGTLAVTGERKTKRIPVNMRIGISGENVVKLSLNLITKNLGPDGDLKMIVDLQNVGFFDRFNATVEYFVKYTATDNIIAKENDSVDVADRVSFTKVLPLRGKNTPDGEYYIEVYAIVDEYFVKDIATFQISRAFWATPAGMIMISLLGVSGLGAFGYFARKKYMVWRKERTRYIFPTNYNKLPQKESNFWIGNIAETKHKAYFNPNDLRTHVLVAGATGAGKSVAASVFVEDALDNNIAVMVFDPTAQWTGFVKPCNDENILKYYDEFGMDTKYAHSYKGNIYEITDPKEIRERLKKNFSKFTIPGEITVFTLDRLNPGQYDEVVGDIISAVFTAQIEESTELKMILVFDEVHRLLEKYGGKGGYISLEKACREFRKWGIGIVMCSQVLSDFKEAIAGNVLTDIQLNTKSLSDIEKVQSKYGEIYAQKISRQGVGVGMIQNPKYNDGKPYFIHFRPTFHNPHKIPNEDMTTYKDFAMRIDKIEEVIAEMKKHGRDTADIEIEFKLTNNKLKQGEFRLAKIYLNSLEQQLSLEKGEKPGRK
jgi:hypothetical protein